MKRRVWRSEELMDLRYEEGLDPLTGGPRSRLELRRLDAREANGGPGLAQRDNAPQGATGAQDEAG